MGSGENGGMASSMAQKGNSSIHFFFISRLSYSDFGLTFPVGNEPGLATRGTGGT
jgi:hypothetical protein